MATQTRGGSKKGRPNSKSAPPRDRSVLYLVIGTVVAIAAAVVVVVLFTGGDDAADPVDPGISQTQPVTVEGGALAPMTDAVDDGGGATAPVGEGRNFEGFSTTVPAPGQPTMIVFGAHWCPHCQANFPVIVDWMNDGGADGVEVVAVSTSVREDAPNYPPSAWLADISWPGRVVADDEAGSMAQAYGLQSFPYIVYVDAEGNVQHRSSGEVDPEELDEGVDAIT